MYTQVLQQQNNTCRLAWALYAISMAFEFALLSFSLVHAINLHERFRVQPSGGNTFTRSLVFMAFSVILTVISFVANILGAAAVKSLASAQIAAVKQSVRSIDSRRLGSLDSRRLGSHESRRVGAGHAEGISSRQDSHLVTSSSRNADGRPTQCTSPVLTAQDAPSSARRLSIAQQPASPGPSSLPCSRPSLPPLALVDYVTCDGSTAGLAMVRVTNEPARNWSKSAAQGRRAAQNYAA